MTLEQPLVSLSLGLSPCALPPTVASRRLMAAADHPNLLSFHEAFIDAGQLYVVTELAPGGDLGALLG